MHMVSIGKGITLVSEGWIHMAFPNLALRPLSAPEDIMPFSAVWSPQNDNPVIRSSRSSPRLSPSSASKAQMKKGTSLPSPYFCKNRSLEITLNRCSARARRSVFVLTILPHFRERSADPPDYSPQSAASYAPTTKSAEFYPRRFSTGFTQNSKQDLTQFRAG
jgi:hypothetical protein